MNKSIIGRRPIQTDYSLFSASKQMNYNFYPSLESFEVKTKTEVKQQQKLQKK